ncbi:hypothetical protein [Catalinimonas niigatensis]|uniref:hypothetical protein n=1 Tax=Catalinimonas niigatensis TaxID=1397264 RepID=UPI002665BD3E|nr:hypothetical protein [Catalinimonas niigatensis]WPP50201.1 hypothetical protein PZB72_26405 [Catalinimonas niigatensis]
MKTPPYSLLWLCLLSFVLGCASQKSALEKSYTQRSEYLEDRNQLIRQDSLMAFDADLQLSPKELAVNRKLLTLRDQMIADYKEANFFPPAHQFLKSKAHIESTDLYQLFQQMPKGGMMHLHPSAGIDFKWLVKKAVEMPNCYVYWEEDDENYTKGQLHFYQQNEAPQGFYPTKEVAHFEQEMYDLLVLDQEVLQDTFDIWEEFELIFQRIGGFFNYQPIYAEYHEVVFDSLLADGVQHVEVRNFPGGLYDLEHAPNSDYYPPDSAIQLLKQVETDIQRRHPQFSLKLIYTSLRFFPEETILQHLEDAYRYRQRYPNFIRGFDLVANEDDGHTTLFFLNNWLKMDSLEKVYGIDMPLYLHDGESDWHTVRNLYDAVLLNSERIGHGFNLNHFPTLQEQIKAKDICLEVCPLSNQILGYVGDLRVHPANYLLRRGVQCTISTDDPAIFGYNGLSYDYWSILLAWQLDLQAIKKLAMNSLIYSSLPENEKEKAMAHWEAQWNEFINYADEFLQ